MHPPVSNEATNSTINFIDFDSIVSAKIDVSEIIVRGVISLNAYPIVLLMMTDIVAIPRPLPDTMKISTNSRRRLKYWATIRVEQSRVMPTPMPTTVP